MENSLDSICRAGIKRLALSRLVSITDAVVLLKGKGDVATNPKPSCVFRGQFPCLSLPNPLQWQFSVLASKTKALVVLYIGAADNQKRANMMTVIVSWTCSVL